MKKLNILALSTITPLEYTRKMLSFAMSARDNHLTPDEEEALVRAISLSEPLSLRRDTNKADRDLAENLEMEMALEMSKIDAGTKAIAEPALDNEIERAMSASIQSFKQERALNLRRAASMQESKTPAVRSTQLPKAIHVKKTRHVIHEARWTIVSGYSDGSSIVNASFVWPAGRDAVKDITAGKIVGDAPYCFLIALFHMNSEFFTGRNIMSPYALSEYLKRVGLPPKPGKMYEQDTIIPVAKHFGAAIQVNIVDAPDHSYEVNHDHTNQSILVVSMSINGRHYISGAE